MAAWSGAWEEGGREGESSVNGERGTGGKGWRSMRRGTDVEERNGGIRGEIWRRDEMEMLCCKGCVNELWCCGSQNVVFVELHDGVGDGGSVREGKMVLQVVEGHSCKMMNCLFMCVCVIYVFVCNFFFVCAYV